MAKNFEKSFKTGDRLKLLVQAQTTDKLLLLTTGGKVFTLQGDKLPGGRGFGEPVRAYAVRELLKAYDRQAITVLPLEDPLLQLVQGLGAMALQCGTYFLGQEPNACWSLVPSKYMAKSPSHRS